MGKRIQNGKGEKMKQIRLGVFETNSSSTHSLTVLGRQLQNSNLLVDEESFIHVSSGEYGWGYDRLISHYDKLSYLVTMMFETDIGTYPLPDDAGKIYNCEAFQLLDQAVFEHTGNHIVLDEVDKEKNIVNIKGYIDHQSTEGYIGLKDFLDSNQISVKEFVFGNTMMIISNDNE